MAGQSQRFVSTTRSQTFCGCWTSKVSPLTQSRLISHRIHDLAKSSVTGTVAAASATASDVATGPDAADAIVDDAQSAVACIRQTAKWFASALAAIPALGIVGSLIKGPGSAGFDPLLLLLGLASAAAGAYLGIRFFSRVLTPLPLEDKDMNLSGDSSLGRLPGQPYSSYQELLNDLVDSRNAYAL